MPGCAVTRKLESPKIDCNPHRGNQYPEQQRDHNGKHALAQGFQTGFFHNAIEYMGSLAEREHLIKAPDIKNITHVLVDIQ